MDAWDPGDWTEDTLKEIKQRRDAFRETHWLYDRFNETIATTEPFVEQGLLILVRTLLGGLWTDDEIIESLRSLPEWWTEGN